MGALIVVAVLPWVGALYAFGVWVGWTRRVWWKPWVRVQDLPRVLPAPQGLPEPEVRLAHQRMAKVYPGWVNLPEAAQTRILQRLSVKAQHTLGLRNPS